MSIFLFKAADDLQIALGQKLRSLRLSVNLDQRTTAEKAGVSERALRNLEAGRGSTVETLLRVLKALDGLHGIEMLVPAISVNPMDLLQRPTAPQRVRRARKNKSL
jgi:transcriptional regulator with XRE-family HTH domain